MENLSIKLNLKKMSRVGVATIRNVKCVVIPIEENDIFVSVDETGKVKNIYLDLAAWANRNGISQYGDSHLIKMSYSEEFRSAHPEIVENSPIVGNAKPLKAGNAADIADAPVVAAEEDNGLPL